MRVKKSAKYNATVAKRLERELNPIMSSATCHILKDDLSLGIIPYQNVNQYVRCEMDAGQHIISPSEIASGFTGKRPYPNPAGELANFIRDTASALVTYGEVSYEVTILSNPSAGQLSKFQVDFIMPRTLMVVAKRPFQILPTPGHFPEIRQLAPDRIFSLGLPSINASEWQRMLLLLADFDKASFNTEIITQPGWSFEAQRHFVEAAQLKVTSEIPWVQRGGLKLKTMSECYFVYRWLGMQRFIARMRASIVTMMNNMLLCTGSCLGFHAIVELEQLPTAADIESAIQRLLTGEVGPSIFEDFLRS